MRSHLRNALKAEAAGPRRPVDPADIWRRGRRRLWIVRSVALSLTIVLAIGSAAVGRSIFDRGGVDKVADRGLDPGSDVPKFRAAVFAIQALGHGGLRQQDGTYVDYEAIVRQSPGRWIADFGPPLDCSHGTYTTEENGRTSVYDDTQDTDWRCEESSSEAVRVTVEISEGSLVVREITGPIDEDAREKILAYREVFQREAARFQVADLAVVDATWVDVIHGTVLWTGRAKDLPALDVCSLRLFDDSNRRISRSDYVHAMVTSPLTVGPIPDLENPETVSAGFSREATRDAHFHVTETKITGEAERAEIEC